MTAIFQGTGHAYTNPAAVKMVGYSSEELQHMNFLDYVHPDFRQLVWERAQARMRGDSENSQYEIRLVTKAGAEMWVEFAAAPSSTKASQHRWESRLILRNENRQRRGSALVERRLRTMVEVTPTMVAIIQGTGHVYLNPAAATMAGLLHERNSCSSTFSITFTRTIAHSH